MNEFTSKELDKLFKSKIGSFSVKSFGRYCSDNNLRPEDLVHVVWTDEHQKNWSMLSRVGYLLSVKNNPHNPAFLKHVIQLYQKEKMLDIQTEPGEPDGIWSYWAMLNMVGAPIDNQVKDAMRHLNQGAAVPGDGGWISKAIEMRLDMRNKDPKAWQNFNDEKETDHKFFLGLLTSNRIFSKPYEYGIPSSPLKAKSEAWPKLNIDKPVEIAVPEGIDENVDSIFQQYIDFASQSKNPLSVYKLLQPYTVRLTDESAEKIITVLSSPVFALKPTKEIKDVQHSALLWRSAQHLSLLCQLIANNQAHKLSQEWQEKLCEKAKEVLSLEAQLQSQPGAFSQLIQQWVLEKELKKNVKKVEPSRIANPLERF